MKNLIVFVDDEENILSGIKRNLHAKRDVWDIKYFTNGHDALEFAKNERVEIMISDMKMPEMTGFELMEQLTMFSPSTIRIILTGQSDEKIAYQSIKLVHQFLHKPFKTAEIIDLIEKSLGYREIISNPYLKDIVNGLTLIPTMPGVYQEISAALEDEETTFQDIGEIVEKDIGLTVSLLKIANSAFFGVGREVSNAIDATMYLGTDVVKNLLLFMSVFSKLDQDLLNDMELGYLWDHSLVVAKISKDIATHVGFDKTQIEACYTAALLHDLGRLILAMNFPDDYRSIMDLGMTSEMFTTVEEEIFGASHSMVGAYLVTIWGLPMEIVNSISNHHKTDSFEHDFATVDSVVYLSNMLYHKLKGTKASFVVKDLDTTKTKLGFVDSLEELEEIAKDIVG